MSLMYALEAAVNGSTGPRAILLYGLGRTKQRRRQSGQRPTPGILTLQRRPRPRGQKHFCGIVQLLNETPLAARR